jgi:hypothetical protein
LDKLFFSQLPGHIDVFLVLRMSSVTLIPHELVAFAKPTHPVRIAEPGNFAISP